MDRISRGDIWTIELANRPKPRPGLIVSINAVNDLCPDVLVIPITTHSGPLRVPLPEQPEQTGLRALKSRLKERIGSLPSPAWPDVEAGMRLVLGLRDAG